MRVFEAMIQKDRQAGRCDFTWPDWWGEVYQEVDVVAYEDHPDLHGKRLERAICVCDDATWEKIAAKKDKAIKLLTEAAANAKGRLWRPRMTRIIDESAVLLAVAKATRGESLTAHEKKILDPDDPTPGVEKGKLFDVAVIARDRGDVLAADL